MYSDKLSYKDWFEFNLDQRAHKNFLEILPILIFMLLTAGIVHPFETTVIGCCLFVFRLMFVIGYRKSPKSRLLGNYLGALSFMFLVADCYWSLYIWIKNTPFV